MVKEQKVGAFEAKTNLARYLNDAERGVVTVVTRRGRPAAKIVPPDAEIVRKTIDWDAFFQRAREFRSRAKPGPESMKELINAGRR